MALQIIEGLINYINANISEQKTHSFSIPPSAATVRESVIVNCDIDTVWNALKPCLFEFSSIVKSTEILPEKTSTDVVGSSRKIFFKDGTQQTIQINQISTDSKSCQVIYSMISSDPSVTYSSSENSITAIKVTNPSNQTYVEWKTRFSNDASLAVIRDSRFKKKEAFKDLISALSSTK
eukprot:413624_1